MRRLIGGAVLGLGCAVFALGGAGVTMEEVTYPEIPAGCSIVGRTGEGFPVAHCADDTYLYADMDGKDGALGTVEDGRWVPDPWYRVLVGRNGFGVR